MRRWYGATDSGLNCSSTLKDCAAIMKKIQEASCELVGFSRIGVLEIAMSEIPHAEGLK